MEQHNRITLRKFRNTDMALFQKWLYRDHVAQWFEQPGEWLAEAENRHGAYSWIQHFIAELADAPMGFAQFYEYCRSGETWHGDIDITGAYSIDYLIGEAGCIGRGLGKELILALQAQIARQDNARLIIVQPEPENKASSAALLSAGFVFDEANRLYRFRLR